MIAKLFPELAEGVVQKVDAPHLHLTTAQTDSLVAPGSRFSLMADVELPPDVHVYAPDAKGYKPVQLVLEPSPDLEPLPAVYPAVKILYLAAIKENAPVFEGTFRISQDVKVSAAPNFVKSLGPNGATITIKGELHYQACDEKTCYLPTSVPLSWQVHVLPLDRQRSPESIQHK
ncbi:MAG: protein-disulfide reductase DsbD domain-containing protein [Candidatus Acidiferrum sp.]